MLKLEPFLVVLSLELDVLGTVDLLDAPPLKPDDELEFKDEEGEVDPGLVLSLVVDLLLEPPLKLPEVLPEDVLVEGLVFELEPGLVENDPDLTEVLGALPVPFPEDFAAYAIELFTTNSNATIIVIIFFFTLSFHPPYSRSNK